jgi:hypothetical protein
MKTNKALLPAALFLIASTACNNETKTNGEEKMETGGTKMNTKEFEGGWQGLTYGTNEYEPMFTIIIKDDGSWTNMTFGEAHKTEGRYRLDAKNQALTLLTPDGNDLYVFKHEPVSEKHKERLIEQRPSNESYKAMVCYRHEPK